MTTQQQAVDVSTEIRRENAFIKTESEDEPCEAPAKRFRAEDDEVPMPTIPNGIHRDDALEVIRRLIGYSVQKNCYVGHLQSVQRKWGQVKYAGEKRVAFRSTK